MPRLAELDAATSGLSAPFAVVDLDAFDRNAELLVRAAASKPLRIATKSLRSRPLLRRLLDRPGYTSLLCFTLPEALWLATELPDVGDVLVGYPTADRVALAALAADEDLVRRVTVMVDCAEQLDLIEAVVGRDGPPIRVCLDFDASLRVLRGALHLGPRRSPLHEPEELHDLAVEVGRRPRLVLAGVMCYEGQIAGIADQAGRLPRRAGIKAFQRVSGRELRRRRARAVAAVREVAPLEFVNGGGTGSVRRTAAEAAVTDVAVGSGLFAPALFDHYSSIRLEPSAYFALDVVRRPGPDHVTVLGGGWVASGPPGTDRLPKPSWPEGLSFVREEGPGEVQTPLTGAPVRELRVGDRVWFRHAKAGELSEHVDVLHLVAGGSVVGEATTYRGEGRTFL